MKLFAYLFNPAKVTQQKQGWGTVRYLKVLDMHVGTLISEKEILDFWVQLWSLFKEIQVIPAATNDKFIHKRGDYFDLYHRDLSKINLV